MNKFFFVIIFALLLALITFIVSLFATTQGSAWFVQQLVVHSNHRLEYQKFSGKLLGHFSFQHLQLIDQDLQLSVPELQWQWQPVYLLRGQLVIDQLKLDGLTLQLRSGNATTSTEKSMRFNDLALPWWLNHILIKQLQVSHWQIIKHHHILAAAEAINLSTNLSSKQSNIDVNAKNLIIQLGGKKHRQLWQLNSQLQVRGSLHHYQWHFGNEVLMPDAKVADHWHFAGDGNASQLHLMQIEANRWPKSLSIDALLKWRSHLNLDVNLHGKFDPAIWRPDLKGMLQLDMNLAADKLLTPQTFWHFSINQLNGFLNHQTVQGEGHLLWQYGLAQIHGLKLAVGDNSLVANGRMSKDSDFSWSIHVPNLHQSFPDLSGQILSQGTLKGDWQLPQLDMDADIKQLHIMSMVVKQLHANASVGGIDNRLNINIVGDTLKFDQHLIQSIQLSSVGSLTQHQVQVALVSGFGNFMAALHGGYHHGQWQGQLSSLQIAPPKLASWRLKQTTDLTLAPQLLQMPQALCLQQAQQSMCLQVHFDHHIQREILLNTSAIDLLPWARYLPTDISLTQGRIQLSAHIKLNHAWQPEGRAELKLWPLTATYQISSDQILPIEVQRGLLNLVFEPTQARLDAQLTSNLGDFNAIINAPQWQEDQSHWLSQPITGKASWQLHNLRLLTDFVPTLQNIEGQVAVQATMSGAMNQPKVYLDAALSNASALLTSYNLTLKNIHLHLQGWADQILQAEGNITSGSGPLAISGQFKELFSGPQFDLHLQGQNVLLTNLPSYVVWANPDVHLIYDDLKFLLKGKVVIPKATLNFVDYGNDVVSLSRDVVYANEKTSHVNFMSDILLQLGNAIDLKYGGLKGNLAGQLHLQDSLMGNTLATGAIHLVDGHYNAYGQDLTIQKGVASFDGGDVANPMLDIEAGKVLKNIVPVSSGGAILQGASVLGPGGTLTVGITITGPLSHYTVRFYSIPPGLQQTDILSYLILGRPASQAGSGGGPLLLAAASALNNGKAGPVSQLQNELRNKLGLDIDVGSTSQYNASTQAVTQGTAVTLTKALSPKLYLSYAVGLSQAVNVMTVRYQMNPKWMAQTESSSLGNGADIFYTIDRN